MCVPLYCGLRIYELFCRIRFARIVPCMIAGHAPKYRSGNNPKSLKPPKRNVLTCLGKTSVAKTWFGVGGISGDP